MTVEILTDSAAALPVDLAATYGIAVVSMWLTIGDSSIREGDVPLGELLARGDVTTSGSNPGEFETAIKERQALTDDGVVVCTIASTMSSTYEAAVVGARAAGGPVRVVDTKTAAGAQGLVVLAAAQAARRGADLDEVEHTARVAMEQVRLVATVPNLDPPVQSGRGPNIAGWAGRRLGLSPLFEFRDGGAHALRPARGSEAARDRILSRWRRDRVPGARLHVAALHAEAEDDAIWLLDRVREEVPEPETAFI